MHWRRIFPIWIYFEFITLIVLVHQTDLFICEKALLVHIFHGYTDPFLYASKKNPVLYRKL